MSHPPPNTPYEYPISLDCELEFVQIEDDLLLRKLDESTRERLLGITDVELDSEGRVAKYTSKAGYDKLLSPDLDRTIAFYASNFTLVSSSTSRASDFNFALKLLSHSRSSLYIGYAQKGAVAFQSPPGYFGKNRLCLTSSTVTELKALLNAVVQRSGDAKLSLMRDIWMYAMSDAPRRESRFVEVSTLLEMLLLPKQSTELGFRFALRLSKLAEKFGFGRSRATFDQAKTLYSIRSKLVHGGTDSRLVKHEAIAYEFARKLLGIYLVDPAVFDEDALDTLCIAA